ncbi:MAG: hypothetical protein R2941_23610 [Desulfobacterales bacterium]
MMISEKTWIHVFLLQTVSLALFLFFQCGAACCAENPEEMIAKARDCYSKGETAQSAMLLEKALALLHPEKSPERCLETAVQLAGIFQSTGFHQRSMAVLNQYLPLAEKNRNYDTKFLFFQRTE